MMALTDGGCVVGVARVTTGSWGIVAYGNRERGGGLDVVGQARLVDMSELSTQQWRQVDSSRCRMFDVRED